MPAEERYVVSLRPIATPLPLTFLGLMVATTVMAGYELRWVPRSEHAAVGWILLSVPFTMQLLAAAWGFAARSAAAATGSALLAGTWLAVALDTITTTPGPAGPTAAAGFLLVASSAGMAVPALAEVREGALLPAGVMFTTCVRFLLTGVSGLTHSHEWTVAAGYSGLVLAAVSLYGALALELESSIQQTLLPTFRLRTAREALRLPLEQQIEGLAREPGVRETL